MASNNIILAVPSANSSVNYELPQSESAKLSFAPEDIDGLKLDASGGLVISFVEGGQVTLTNFQNFIDNGNTLSLADGTNVDPKLLFNALGGINDNAFPTAASDAISIDVPAANAQNEIKLEPGQKYLMNFDLSETTGANVKDGQMVIGFANGGKIVIANYESAMADKTPPELSLASKTCVVTGDELITNIQKLAATEVVEEEKEEDAKTKSKIVAADMEGQDNSGIVDPTKLGYKTEEKKGEGEASDSDAEKVANVEPAAGEEADIARQLAAIETAAGPGAGGAGRAGGYGYGSRFAPDPFATNPDIGPIDPTQLRYRAPILTPSEFLIDRDDNPNMIGPDAKFVDETDLDNGPLVVSGELDIDFGADGPGGVSPNGTFTSGGSQTGGVLSSNGEPITVTVVGNTYVGVTSGGDKVFELTIDPNNGDYTYTQYLTIDHADGTNPNDQIVLEFGVVVSDSDGDTDSTTIQIVVADDAPVIEGSSASVDETDFGATISATGNLVHDYNQDGPGKIEATGTFTSGGSQKGGALTAGGVPVVVSSTATGYEGKANGVVVFTLTINPSTGDYTYTQFKNLDHADGSNPDDEITLTFGAKITDYDGDSAIAPIVITIVDDGPDFQSCGCGPKPDKGLEIVDETNLKNGPAIETGKLDANFGADKPGSYGFKADSFESSGSKTGGALTHNGIPVVVTLVNGEWVGKAGDTLIFKLELNTSTGDYKFTLYDNLDHADKTNPDDQIVLDFGVIASDYDGDGAEGSIRIIVKDDGPVANDDINTYDTTFGVANGNVVTGLNGGAGAADVASTDGWTATDSSNKVVKIAFGGNEVDVPATGTVSIDGEYGTLTISADGTYTYKAFDNGGMIDHGGQKEFISGPVLPDFDESEALDNVEKQSLGVAPGNLTLAGGETISVTFHSEQAANGNTLGVFTVGPDGKLQMEKVLIKDGNTAVAGQTFSYTAGSNAKSLGFFIVADGADVNKGYPGIDFNKGALNFVFDYGLPTQRDALATDDGSHIKLVYTSEGGVNTVINGPLYFTSDRGGMDNLNADDSVRVVSGIPGSDDNVLRIGFEDKPNLGDKDFNDMVFDITITGKDCGCGDPAIKDQFVYTLQDGDGDKDTATLTLNGQDLTDDKPILVTPAIETVDESNLTGGAITETGTIAADFGHDGPGTLAGNGAFTSGGSKLGGALTSGGVPVTVALNGNVYEGKANGVTVFTLMIASNGSYTFKLFQQLDHADGTNPNDAITLNFGVDAIDCDGDKTGTTLTVKVLDDAPDAKDDTNAAGEGQTVTGNVKNNDVVGQDTPGTITKVVFGGTTFDLPANGSNVVITGQYGKLTINNTGAYSYTANTNNPNGVDSFAYTLKDRDGDTDTATLKINVTCTDDVPVIQPSVETVDETGLASGIITETGSVAVNYGGDGPGIVTGNGSFTSGGSKLGGALTHQGQAVSVTLAGDTYTGKTAGGVTVFTLQVASNGSYTFKLFEQLDHADGTNANDVITLNFGVTATDADGDASSTTITVNVKDDAPIANDDARQMVNGTSTINGNVTTNDVVGQDTPGNVTKITFGGTTKDVPASGTVSIAGAYGTLVIDHTGSYTYTAKPGATGTDSFTYVLRDNDGDTDPACLAIEVKPNPLVVCIFADDQCVKEDGHVGVPVNAYFTGSNGNETMTITLTGVPAGWTIAAPGWTLAGGVYTLVLAQGVTTWNGTVDFKPPANSDVDLNGLIFKASVYDPDNSSTTFATEDVNIIVDAVVEPFTFKTTVNGAEDTSNINFFLVTNQAHTERFQLSIKDVTHTDTDGSESIKKVIFTLEQGMDPQTYIAVQNNDGSFSKVGVKGSDGADTTYTIDLSGMTYAQAVNYLQNKLYLVSEGNSNLDGGYDLDITLVKYEKNLSGIEKDYTDNETSYTVTKQINYCLSPLVIDLDRDGVELLSQQNGVMFDMTKDGVKDHTGWVAKDDALLVLDKNHDGLINDRSELFGNDEEFANGFDSLAAYDSNKDGVIDSKDAVFNELRVWQDVNSDGISQESEMRSLHDVNIAAIQLAATAVNYQIAGNSISHESTVIYGDGSSSDIVDAWFTYQNGNSAGVDKGLTVATPVVAADAPDIIVVADTGAKPGNELPAPIVGHGPEPIYDLPMPIADNGPVPAGNGDQPDMLPCGYDPFWGWDGQLPTAGLEDKFLFQTITEGADKLKDFQAGIDDRFDISNVVSNSDPVSDAINNFVFATDNNDNQIREGVIADVPGGVHQFSVADSQPVNVTDLFNNGSIIV